MDRYTETFETWNKIASIYEDKFMDLDLYNESYDFICNSIINEKPTILEIGCGPGNITKYLLSKRPDFNIYGIDISPNMIELAKKNNPMASFAVMDCRQINELTSKFDGVICGFCLPFLSPKEASKLISDSYDLLNDNGLLYISFVEGDLNLSGFKAGNGNRVYFNYHDLEELIQALEDFGFEKPKIFKVDYKKSDENFEVHTILISRKN